MRIRYAQNLNECKTPGNKPGVFSASSGTTWWLLVACEIRRLLLLFLNLLFHYFLPPLTQPVGQGGFQSLGVGLGLPLRAQEAHLITVNWSIVAASSMELNIP